MKVGEKVRVVDHEGYEDILRVDEVGEVAKITEETVSLRFDGVEEAVDYPRECVRDLTEEEQKQLKGGGKEGMPDTSKPTPPQVNAAEVKLKGEQEQVAQGDSPTSRPEANSAFSNGVTSDKVELKGEQKDVEGVPQGTGGTSSKTRPETGGSQGAGVQGAQVELKGEQPQMKGVPSREVAKGVKESRVFRPVGITVLEQGDGEDEYVAIGEGTSIRNEKHLISAIKASVHRAMESMEKPFDRVEVVFRRDAIAESERRDAEKKLLAALHLLDEGKGNSRQVREAANAAAKNGVRTARYESYTDDAYAKKMLTEAQALVEQSAGGPVTIIWPPAELSKHLGQHLIVESIFGDRWVGTLAQGPGRMYQIKTKSGTHKFSPNDVNRILAKPGAK